MSGAGRSGKREPAANSASQLNRSLGSSGSCPVVPAGKFPCRLRYWPNNSPSRARRLAALATWNAEGFAADAAARPVWWRLVPQRGPLWRRFLRLRSCPVAAAAAKARTPRRRFRRPRGRRATATAHTGVAAKSFCTPSPASHRFERNADLSARVVWAAAGDAASAEGAVGVFAGFLTGGDDSFGCRTETLPAASRPTTIGFLQSGQSTGRPTSSSSRIFKLAEQHGH